MDRLNEIGGWVNNIITNFRKNPNRSYSANHLSDLENQIKQNSDILKNVLNEIGLVEQIAEKRLIEDCQNKIVALAAIVQSKREPANGQSTSAPKQTTTANSEPSDFCEEERIAANQKMASVSFKDIEEALEKFDGFSAKINSWILQFEAVATSCEFSIVQKYLFCRRLLSGAARLAVEAETDLGDYAKLKEFLIKEFTVEVKSSEIHAELAGAQKRKSETSIEFAYRVKRIAGQGNVDEPSLNDYIINGLGASRPEKASLFEARDFAELRRKLVAYDKANPALLTKLPSSRGDTKEEKPRFQTMSRPYGASAGPSRVDQVKRCYSCGKTGHMAKECARPNVQCFRCGEMGHISPACPVKKAEPVSVVELTRP